MKISGMVLVVAIATAAFGGEERNLHIDGSNGARPLFQALTEAFSKSDPAISIELGEGMSTTERLEALEAGRIHLASASHGIEAEKLKPFEAVALRFAKMAVVFGVHETAGVSDLSAIEISSIYTGAISNWKEVGGADLEIVRLMRPDDEVDTELVRAGIPGLKELRWDEEVRIIQKSGELAKELASTPGAIGVTSLVRAMSAESIEVVALDGIHPVNVKADQKSYPLYRDFYVIVPSKPSNEAIQFLRFIDSSRAGKAMADSFAENSPGEIGPYLEAR